ncbi:MAG TPA: GNAT family N-acetyltransferase [Rhizomicrobium sp.]
MAHPVLQTDRLVLRPPVRDDFAAHLAMWSDPEVCRFISGRPLAEEDSWARLMRLAGHWALAGYGFWSLFEKASGLRVGEAGFLDLRRDMVPRLDETPEIGWGLVRAAQGKGYAGEAVAAALAWGEARFGKVRFSCIIDPDNGPSLRVAARAGFREALRTTYKDKPIVVLYRDPS